MLFFLVTPSLVVAVQPCMGWIPTFLKKQKTIPTLLISPLSTSGKDSRYVTDTVMLSISSRLSTWFWFCLYSSEKKMMGVLFTLCLSSLCLIFFFLCLMSLRRKQYTKWFRIWQIIEGNLDCLESWQGLISLVSPKIPLDIITLKIRTEVFPS